MRFERRYRDLEMEYEVLSMKQLLHGLETDRLQMIIVYTAELEKVSGIYCRRLDNVTNKTRTQSFYPSFLNATANSKANRIYLLAD